MRNFCSYTLRVYSTIVLTYFLLLNFYFFMYRVLNIDFYHHKSHHHGGYHLCLSNNIMSCCCRHCYQNYHWHCKFYVFVSLFLSANNSNSKTATQIFNWSKYLLILFPIGTKYYVEWSIQFQLDDLTQRWSYRRTL